MPFEPFGVIEPVTWIVHKQHSDLYGSLKAVQDIVTAEGYQDMVVERNLAKRYVRAEGLYRKCQFQEAEAAFKELGDYRDSQVKAKKIKELRYKLQLTKSDKKDGYNSSLNDIKSVKNS